MNSMVRHARKSLELHKWCTLRLSRKLDLNASASSNPATATSQASPQETFIVSNLIDLYGWIRKTSKRVSKVWKRIKEEEEEAKSDSVSNLSRSPHRRHISRNITCYRRLLIDAEKTLVPNLSFFSSEKLQALSASKMITLETLYGAKKNRNSMVSPQDGIIRDVFILKVLGVPQELLIPLLNFDTLESFTVKEKYMEVVEMGLDSTTLKIFQALRVFYRDKTIQEKVNFFTRLGMDDDL